MLWMVPQSMARAALLGAFCGVLCAALYTEYASGNLGRTVAASAALLRTVPVHFGNMGDFD
jgi:hypothetical protein